ncbi:hypothetical protein JCM10207_007318 [Rhodosporidiobolus poonsookiae]
MRMLDKDKEAQSEDVRPEDQSRINRFSRLNARVDEVIDELDVLKKQREDLEEVEGEVELLEMDGLGEDEDGERGEGKIMYKLDSTFVHLPPSEVLEHIQASLTKIRGEVEALEKERDGCEEEMEGLKKELYAKFGNSINLERGDD